ncbi:ABC transporter substrate-binding protein [Frankia sp. CcWB3]
MIHGFRSTVAGLALLSVVALAACDGGGKAEPARVSGEVKIGLLAPLTQGNPETGRDAQRGAELASRLINAGESWAGDETRGSWGPSGRAQLSVVTLDTSSDPRQAADVTSRLMTNHGVVGIVGAFTPDATLEASQRAERLQIPFVSGGPPLTALTERGLSWFFRIGPDAADYGGTFLSLLRDAEQPGQERRRVALLYTNDATGLDMQATVAEFAEETGYPVVASVAYQPGTGQPGTGDLAAAVGALRTAAPDVVLTNISPSQGEILGNTFRDGGYIPPAVVVYGDPAEAARLAAVPEFADRVSRQVAWSMPIARANPLAARVIDRYLHDFGAPMTEDAAEAFTAVTTIAQAIDDAGSADRELVRSALTALNLPASSTIMPWNGVHFDGTHQNTLSATAIEQATGTTFRTVYPRDLATTTVRWPAPGTAVTAVGHPSSGATSASQSTPGTRTRTRNE